MPHTFSITHSELLLAKEVRRRRRRGDSEGEEDGIF
jgi:hypothetical protein